MQSWLLPAADSPAISVTPCSGTPPPSVASSTGQPSDKNGPCGAIGSAVGGDASAASLAAALKSRLGLAPAGPARAARTSASADVIGGTAGCAREGVGAVGGDASAVAGVVTTAPAPATATASSPPTPPTPLAEALLPPLCLGVAAAGAAGPLSARLMLFDTARTPPRAAQSLGCICHYVTPLPRGPGHMVARPQTRAHSRAVPPPRRCLLCHTSCRPSSHSWCRSVPQFARDTGARYFDYFNGH